MASFFSERPLIKVAAIGLILLPFLYIFNSLSPPPEKAPKGYSSTIIAFEMASNKKELEEVLAPLSSEEITNLDKLNYVDFGFMVTYGLFLFVFMSKFFELTDNPSLIKARWLAPVIVIADVLENVQLLKLSHFYPTMANDLNASLNLLAIFTWVKWILLAAAFSLIGYAMIKLKLWSKIVGVFLIIPLILGIYALISGQNQVEDLFATSVFSSFFLTFVYSFLYKKS